MFLYRDILKKTWKVTWGHKYLWIFGFFAALLSGIGRYNVSFSRSPESWNSSAFASLSNLIGEGLFTGKFFSSMAEYFKQDATFASIYLVFLIVVLFFSLLFLWLAVVSQGGLINNAVKIIKTGKKVSLKEGFSVGNRNFWQVLGINLITAALMSFFAALVGLPLLYAIAYYNPVVSLLYFLLFLLFIPLALIISFLGKYAICYKIIKKKSFVDSIVEAINLFSKNWIISIEMSLILFLIDIAAIFGGALIILSLSVPYRFLAIAAALTISPVIYWIAIGIGLVLAIVFIVILGSALVTFKTIAWSDMFVSLVDKKGNLPKIVRLISKKKK